MNPQYYRTLENSEIQCILCPYNCRIKPGRSGVCRVRTNNNGIMELPYYGKISSVAVDPIEKKPLYHFFPGSKILSIGFWGCNFHCPFCQNYQISQQVSNSQYLAPQQVVDMAKEEHSFAIAYTYSEPLIHFEYIKETATLAGKQGIKNVLVSNGYINEQPAAELLDLLDAVNIDLKSFNPDFYHKEIGGKLEEVKRFIQQAVSRTILEVTTLVIPGKNDSEQEIIAIAGFLASLNRSVPLHLSCYYPTYQYNIRPTAPDDIFALADSAGKYLDYVYPGNVGYRETNTLCPQCHNIIIRRAGYKTAVTGLDKGKCHKCGNTIYGNYL